MEQEILSFESGLKQVIRDVPDFPKEGIIFKDITPVLSKPGLRYEVLNELTVYTKKHIDTRIDGVACIESRGFLFGMGLAHNLWTSFIPIRKAGKLPYHKISESYDLEYGQQTIEVHTDAILPGHNYVIHDDLIAIGGTANACANLIKKQGGNVAGFVFLIELEFLKGREKLLQHVSEDKIVSLIKY